MSDKASFRAERERLGLTQQNISDALGVNIQTVKRWERLEEAEVPDDVWDYIDQMADKRDTMIDGMVDSLGRILAMTGELPEVVRLTYFRSQSDYDQHGRDEGYYGFVNSATRKAAELMQEKYSVEVEYIYPQEKQLDY